MSEKRYLPKLGLLGAARLEIADSLGLRLDLQPIAWADWPLWPMDCSDGTGGKALRMRRTWPPS